MILQCIQALNMLQHNAPLLPHHPWLFGTSKEEMWITASVDACIKLVTHTCYGTCRSMSESILIKVYLRDLFHQGEAFSIEHQANYLPANSNRRQEQKYIKTAIMAVNGTRNMKIYEEVSSVRKPCSEKPKKVFHIVNGV